MDKIRKFLVFIVCLWIFGSCLLCAVSASSSLWGKKVDFKGRNCYWQLSKTFTVPPLEELTVCVDLWRLIPTSEWTAFVYKKPGDHNIELGLSGSGGNLRAWFFGKEWIIAHYLSLQTWHSICLTWSHPTQKVQLTDNGTVVFTSNLYNKSPGNLAPNGTLTLGVSHSVVNGVMNFETGTNFIGEITMFRMWGQELNPEQLANLKCVSGNIATWSLTNWEYNSCPPVFDHRLKCECSKYRINMKLNITHEKTDNLNEIESRDITLKWLKSVFPPNISVHLVVLSSDREPSEHESTEIKSRTVFLPKHERFSCLVYVIVSPAAAVDNIQALIWTIVTPAYKHSEWTVLQTDPSSVNVHPVDFFKIFYRVYMNATISGILENAAQTLQLWIHQTLGEGDHMGVLNYKLTTTKRTNKLTYGCTFQVQTPPSTNVIETEKIIFNLLTEGFTNGSIEINVPTDQINITHIDPGLCPDDTTLSVYGTYAWPPTPPEDKYDMKCEKGLESAVRYCKLADNDKAVWDSPDLSKCEKIMNGIDDLKDITVTPENSEDVVEMIHMLVQNQTNLTSSELSTVLQKLSDVACIGTMTTALAHNVINVVSNIFGCSSYVVESTNEILSITDQVGNRLDFSEDVHNTTAPSLAVQLVNQDPLLYKGLTFGVSSFQTSFQPEIFLEKIFVEQPFIGHVASISLPTSLEMFFPQSPSRLQFHFYGTDNLFQDSNSSLALNSYVVSASVTNSIVSNLKEPVVVTLLHLNPKEDQDTVQCVYWNIDLNNGSGGWDDNGCQVKHTNATHTSCLCFHLTHFGVLLDISKTPISKKDDMILTVLTYLGCGLSSIFLGITLLTYVAFEKLRMDNPSKILINLSAALLALNLLFLINSWLASFNSHDLCITIAAFQHYFFLATFTWMGLEAINMYLAFVKVFNVYVPSYILKFCILGWGIPLVIVSLVLAVDKNCYGSTSSVARAGDQSSFCWVQNETAFYVTVVLFVALILLCNIIVFGVVLMQIRGMKLSNAPSRCNKVLHDVRVVASLTFLLGLTWILAFLTWGPVRVPFLYIFSLLNSLQGFFIFLFHCLMKENVRKQWRIHLCCGRFKPTSYSDWSNAKSAKLAHTSSENSTEQKISRSSQTDES